MTFFTSTKIKHTMSNPSKEFTFDKRTDKHIRGK
jgi:hypothetical protein